MNAEINNESIKRNFLLPLSLSKQVEATGEKLGLNFSQVVRKALEDFINKVEKEKLAKEMIEACKYYSAVDEEIAADWKEAEGKF